MKKKGITLGKKGESGTSESCQRTRRASLFREMPERSRCRDDVSVAPATGRRSSRASVTSKARVSSSPGWNLRASLFPPRRRLLAFLCLPCRTLCFPYFPSPSPVGLNGKIGCACVCKPKLYSSASSRDSPLLFSLSLSSLPSFTFSKEGGRGYGRSLPAVVAVVNLEEMFY